MFELRSADEFCLMRRSFAIGAQRNENETASSATDAQSTTAGYKSAICFLGDDTEGFLSAGIVDIQVSRAKQQIDRR
jgi:hypothetical protein